MPSRGPCGRTDALALMTLRLEKEYAWRQSRTYLIFCLNREWRFDRWGPGKTVGIIGGKGQMGQLFGRFFEAQGYRSDPGRPRLRNRQRRSHAIVGYRPFCRTASRDREHYPRARSPCSAGPTAHGPEQPQGRVPSKAMLRSPSAVVGLHPMFGGNISSFTGQTIVACPVRIDPRRVERVCAGSSKTRGCASRNARRKNTIT